MESTSTYVGALCFGNHSTSKNCSHRQVKEASFLKRTKNFNSQWFRCIFYGSVRIMKGQENRSRIIDGISSISNKFCKNVWYDSDEKSIN